ncbi:MAG TPA: class I SAM-dependent methyltransferase [Caulobacteraceae bacterium]|nr:class I SAM-dependent methyltransferase [Caulobacteraceae bacterium]
MIRPPYAKKKRALGSWLRETALAARYRRHRVEAFFDYDWARIGIGRADIVRRLMVGRCAYLEIGCAENLLFDTIEAELKVGVDPAQGGTHRMTSDAFFAANTLAFDVVFIDGLHHYAQVRRDVENALAVLNPGGWIALHDMFPRDWIEEHVPQIATSRWTGDPWKVAFELAVSPGVDFRLVRADHGVGIVRRLGGEARLADRRAELAGQRFAWFRDQVGELPVIDWPAAEAWVGEQSPRP